MRTLRTLSNIVKRIGWVSDLLKYRTIFGAEELNGKRRNKGSFDLRKRGRLLNVMARDWAEKQKVDSQGTRECIEWREAEGGIKHTEGRGVLHVNLTQHTFSHNHRTLIAKYFSKISAYVPRVKIRHPRPGNLIWTNLVKNAGF